MRTCCATANHKPVKSRIFLHGMARAYMKSSAQDRGRRGSVLTTKTATQKTMKRIKQVLLIAALTCVTSGLTQLHAQDNNNNNNNSDRRNRFRGGNFDPAQMQERIVENSKDALEVKHDTE